MVTFVEMSRGEARAFLEQFLARAPQRLEELRRDVAAETGTAPEELDLSPESLDRVWEWAKPKLAWRDGYHPPPTGEPGPRGPIGELEPTEELPDWFDPPVYGWWRYSAPTLWLIDGLAHYLAASILHTTPGSQWTVGHSRRRGYVYQNHPVITGLPPGDELEPICVTTVVVTRALGGGDTTLRSIHEFWTT